MLWSVTFVIRIGRKYKLHTEPSLRTQRMLTMKTDSLKIRKNYSVMENRIVNTDISFKSDLRGKRKVVLRGMKRVMKIVRDHIVSHRRLLDQEWKKTEWTQPQVEQILQRIDAALTQLPTLQ